MSVRAFFISGKGIIKAAGSFITVMLYSVLVVSQHVHQETKKDKPLTEDDYYTISTILLPDDIILEVGGLASMPDGRLAVCTRRGEVWIIENPDQKNAKFTLFASGLHEPLGIAYKGGSFYIGQRAELTKVTDLNGDDKADLFESLCVLPLSGDYCEYTHGPIIDSAGNFYMNLNLGDNGFGGNFEPFYGEMGSHAKWRGWMVRVRPDGVLVPYAAGERSPAGIGFNAQGDVFYTENQGGWVGTGYLTVSREGDFFGHPSSLKSTGEPGSPVTVTRKDIPLNAPLLHEAARKIKGFRMPSVRIPHGILGISAAGFVPDNTKGGFGPFQDQVFVGDEGHANIVRVFLEKVNGEYQGVVFPFRTGFESGILRMEWGKHDELFVGMSDRGWNSVGPVRYGLQKLQWTGKLPFEIKTIQARPDGFELSFTMPVDTATIKNPDNIQISGFTYLYHTTYGSDVQDKKDGVIKAMQFSEDRLSVRLVVDGLREGYIHELKCEGILSASGLPLLHKIGYYTLNSIPSGAGLDLRSPGVVSIAAKKTPAPTVKTQTVKAKASVAKMVTKMPASWSAGPDQTITIGTLPGMKYDMTRFRVKPGQKIKLLFNNNDDMQHNIVIVSPGAADQVGEAALQLGLNGSAMNYVPRLKSVLYHTGLLQPRSQQAIYFEAPVTEGRYPFICTYPGHYLVMRGIMAVGK